MMRLVADPADVLDHVADRLLELLAPPGGRHDAELAVVRRSARVASNTAWVRKRRRVEQLAARRTAGPVGSEKSGAWS